MNTLEGCKHESLLPRLAGLLLPAASPLVDKAASAKSRWIKRAHAAATCMLRAMPTDAPPHLPWKFGSTAVQQQPAAIWEVNGGCDIYTTENWLCFLTAPLAGMTSSLPKCLSNNSKSPQAQALGTDSLGGQMDISTFMQKAGFLVASRNATHNATPRS